MTEIEGWNRVKLGTWPTPLERAPRLAVALGLGDDDLWVKRDDLTGLGGGGNKVRKLEWLAGTALAQGATTLVTSGAPQSNHARLTAAAGARLGMEVVLVLAGEPTGSESGNLALDGILGARVVRVGELSLPQIDEVAQEVAEGLRSSGSVPAVIPFGGSSVLGAQGYVDAGRELLAQAPDLDTAVVAVGSGGTMAGLVHALGADRVFGVDCGAVSDAAATVTTADRRAVAERAPAKATVTTRSGRSRLFGAVGGGRGRHLAGCANRGDRSRSHLHGSGSRWPRRSCPRPRHQAWPSYRANPHRRNAGCLRTSAINGVGSEAASGATLVWSLKPPTVAAARRPI